MSETDNRDDQHFALWYMQNYLIIWRTQNWAIVLLVTALVLSFMKPDWEIFLAVASFIFLGVVLAPYTAWSFYRCAINNPALFSEVGKRYAEIFDISKGVKTMPFERNLFYHGKLWKNFVFRSVVLILISFSFWYYLIFTFGHLRNNNLSPFVGVLMFYCIYGWHWLVVRWWWKYRVVGVERYRQLYYAYEYSH